MSIDKALDYTDMDIATDGKVIDRFKNYKKGKHVNVPTTFQARSHSTPVKLAYITDEEAGILSALKPGVPHDGPMHIPNYNDYDPDRGYTSGAAMSAAETGSTASNNRDIGASNLSTQNVQDLRSSAIASGAGQRVNPGFFDSRNTVSPLELARAKAFSPTAFGKTRGSGIMDFITGGGIIGGLIRGVGQKLGLGKTYDQPTYDMSGYSSLGLGGTNQEGFGVPTQAGDYDVLGNKINEITGEITSPEGASLGFLEGYPGEKKGVETIGGNGDDSRQYVDLIKQYLPVVSDVELNDGAFVSRFLNNRTKEERDAIEKMINEKFKYNYNSFGLGDMDGS